MPICNTTPFCPDCSTFNVKLIGVLPNVCFFAGKVLNQAIAGGSLYACLDCHLKFRFPIESDNISEEAYDNNILNAWDSCSDSREDWLKIKSIVVERLRPKSRVLDVGCYTGGLLRSLGDNFVREGVEPNTIAASIVRNTISSEVYSSIYDIPSNKLFDAIVTTDVLEHIGRPTYFLNLLVEHLCKDGVLIIGTGDIDSFMARKAGANWWYCFYPEHISFTSIKWFKRYCEVNCLHLEYHYSYYYNRLKGMSWLKSTVLSFFYGIMGK